MHGVWSSNIPSRFLNELPEAHVEVAESSGGYSGYGPSRFDEMTHFGSTYGTPGWQRAQRKRQENGFADADDAPAFEEDALSGYGRSRMAGGMRRAWRSGPLRPERDLVVKSTGTVSDYSIGDRVFHQKFGNGNVIAIDGNKLTIAFDAAGEKRVVDRYVEKV
jgi:DNA helicase-2/ATP-dependent DNA helicase PcrA